MGREKTLAEIIVQVRRALGLPQRELVRVLGVKQNTISQYETGKAIPSIEVLVRLYAVAPEGQEKQFLHDFLVLRIKEGVPHHPELAEDILQGIADRSDLLGKIPAEHGEIHPETKRFWELATTMRIPDAIIDKSVNDILEMWLKFGDFSDPDPYAIPIFRDAAAYVRVNLDRLAEHGPPPPSEGKRKRLLAELGISSRPENTPRKAESGAPERRRKR